MGGDGRLVWGSIMPFSSSSESYLLVLFSLGSSCYEDYSEIVYLSQDVYFPQLRLLTCMYLTSTPRYVCIIWLRPYYLLYLFTFVLFRCCLTPMEMYLAPPGALHLFLYIYICRGSVSAVFSRLPTFSSLVLVFISTFVIVSTPPGVIYICLYIYTFVYIYVYIFMFQG